MPLLPKIPFQPLTWSAAEPILKGLGGGSVPVEWQGGLPFHYRFGPGPAQVSMDMVSDFKRRDGWNVLATIAGNRNDEIVMLGSHHDAWVLGASDPLSGATVMLELARVMRTMVIKGWTPERTIVFAFWDGEEQNLLGSTHYVDSLSKNESAHIAAYVNVDALVSNWHPDASLQLSVDASPILVEAVSRVLPLAPAPYGGDSWANVS